METNKYYNPEIEEFHVGFEFEYKKGFLSGTCKTQADFDAAEWKKQIAITGDLIYIERALRGKNAENRLHGIRVKLLDHEDIESLGWVWTDSTWRIKERGVPEKEYAIGHKKLFLHGKSIHIIHDEYYGENSTNIFNGEIKNKSELRRIMKQLKI